LDRRAVAGQVSEGRFYEAPLGGEGRRSAPAALRNREPIAAVLQDWLPQAGLVLEIASGTGEHALAFSERFPALQWQPSDVDPAALASIEAWRTASGVRNLLPPLRLDAAEPARWPVSRADAILSINMVHISPWSSALGLLDGAARLLPPGGPLILYGPWLCEAEEPAPSNLEFDAQLRARNPEWGLRLVEDFAAAAADRGLELAEQRAMPAHNRMLLLRRREAQAAVRQGI
jgi:hypothetical protein